MRSQTLISIIVFWVTVLCFTIAVSDDDDSVQIQSKELELANKLNTLVLHSGWRSMGNVQINKIKNQRREIVEPLSAINEAVSSERNPVDESNVKAIYEDVWTVLRCKYAEVFLKCKILIEHVMRVCRNEKKTDYFQKYYDCFRLLLIKLHSLSSRFKCMADALDFMHSIDLTRKLKRGVMVAAEILTEYTSTVGPKTSSKLTEFGIKKNVVDREMKNIHDYFMFVYMQNIYRFINYHCNSPTQEEWTIERLIEDYEYKKSHQQIPEDTTMVQYVIDEMDRYVSGISDSCFYNFGFAYDLTGNVTIRNI